MNKLKGFYRNNRVFVILMGVATLCMILILVVLFFYLTGQRGGNLWGNRLQGIESFPIVDTRLREIEEVISEIEIVDRASVRIVGRIVYINVFLNDGRASDAQEIAMNSLEHFSEEELSFYDLHFAFAKTEDEEESEFPIMGSMKSTNRVIRWTNF